MNSSKHLHLFFLLLIQTTSSQSIIKTLPGYSGPLPFKLETGYVSVGENDEKELFYYFIESERNPQTDPLLFWLTGGPGCSGFSGLVIEIGPLSFDLATFDGGFPSLIINPYSWTKVASVIFIDAPVGTGFSYSITSEGYHTSDTISTNDNYLFLRKGYTMGNPRTNEKKDDNEKIPFAHRTALISDEYFELAKSSCDGEYINVDPNNYKCLYALQFVKEHYNYVPTYVWANNETVQEALHVRKGMITDWKRCNKTLLSFYEEDVESVFGHHQLLNEKGFQTLAYSGDHDLGIPYISTIKWIRNLNLTVDDEWRPWYVGGQIAGYTERYKNNQAYITFATVKGAGHTAPEYKPKECLAMIERWLSLFPL